MVLTSGSIVGGLQQTRADLDFGVGPIPVPDGTSLVRSPMNAGFPYSISTTAKDVEAAATVFEAMVGAAMQAALAENGIPPLSPEAWDSPAATQNDWLQLFRPTELDQQWPKNPGSLIAVEGETVDTLAVSLILDESSDIRGALRDLSKRYQAAYDKGVENGEIDPAEFGV